MSGVPETPLIQAVLRHDVTGVKKLLQGGAVGVNKRAGTDEATALYYAVKEGSAELVDLIFDLADQCNLDLGSADGITPFQMACGEGHLFIAQHLHLRGCDVNKVDVDGRTAVHHAAVAGHAQILKYLILEIGLDQNQPDTSGHTALHLAAINKQHRALAQLIKCGCQLNTFNNEDATPLISVCQRGHVELAKIFIHEILLHGSRDWLDEVDYCGRTALYSAVNIMQLDIVHYLIKAGADPNICRTVESKKPLTGASPLLRAIQHGSLALVEEILQAKGCDIDQPFRGLKVTPLHWAVVLDCETTHKWHNVSEKSDSSPVVYLQIIQRLLKLKPSLNTLDDTYYSPLIIASYHGNRAVIKLLSDHGADLNMKCKKFLKMDEGGKLYLTAIDMALWMGRTEIVQDLVAAKAEFLIGEWIKVPELRERLNDNTHLLEWIKQNRK